MNTVFKWAARYLDNGWSVIPIQEKSKEPLIPWVEYQKRRATKQELAAWVAKWPSMNIGIVTGSISSLVVVDLDGTAGISFGLKARIVSPVSQKTGKGKQVFYKWTEPVANSASKIAPGVDIRGDGGFVVVPPSVHPNGRRYRWERFVPTRLPSLPPRILQASSTDVTPKSKESGWISKALEDMKIGNIDTTLTSILGRLRRDGYSEADAQSLLSPHAERAGATPGHLDEKIRNLWNRYACPAARNDTPSSLHIHAPANDGSYDIFQHYLATTVANGTGLRTGFPTLDKMLAGGLKSERLFTLAARTGTGKTNWAINCARTLCEQGQKVLFFSTEFRYEKVWKWYYETLDSVDAFRGHAFYVCDSFSPNLSQIEEAIQTVNPDVFIFDHINQVTEDHELLSTIMRGCNFLQRKYKCQGIMVAQLNRQADWVEGGKRIEPRMSMIKGSGTIEQASSRVLLLSETRVTPEYNEILGVLDKNDSGDKGLINFALYKSPYHLKELG